MSKQQALAKASSDKAKKPNVQSLERILGGIILSVNKQRDKFEKYVNTARKEGLTDIEIFNLGTRYPILFSKEVI